jgi:hypothetical protein
MMWQRSADHGQKQSTSGRIDRGSLTHGLITEADIKLKLPAYLCVLYLFRMHRFDTTELRERALAAVDEAADQSANGPVQRTLALRFALAFLANFADDRWPFDNFWRAIVTQDEKVRRATAIAARNAIRRAIR